MLVASCYGAVTVGPELRGPVEGRVYGLDGEVPLAGAEVFRSSFEWIYLAGGGPPLKTVWATSGADGRFRLPGALLWNPFRCGRVDRREEFYVLIATRGIFTASSSKPAHPGEGDVVLRVGSGPLRAFDRCRGLTRSGCEHYEHTAKRLNHEWMLGD